MNSPNYGEAYRIKITYKVINYKIILVLSILHFKKKRHSEERRF